MITDLPWEEKTEEEKEFWNEFEEIACNYYEKNLCDILRV